MLHHPLPEPDHRIVEAVNQFLQNPLYRGFRRGNEWHMIACHPTTERSRVFARTQTRDERLRCSRVQAQRDAAKLDDVDHGLARRHELPYPPAAFKEGGLEFPRTRVFYSKIDNWPSNFPAHLIARAYSHLPRLPTRADFLTAFLSVLRDLGFRPQSHFGLDTHEWHASDLSAWLSSDFPGALLMFEELHKLVGHLLLPLASLSVAQLEEKYREMKMPSTVLEHYPEDWLYQEQPPYWPEMTLVEYIGVITNRLSPKEDLIMNFSFFQLTKPTDPVPRTPADKKPNVLIRLTDKVRRR